MQVRFLEVSNTVLSLFPFTQQAIPAHENLPLKEGQILSDSSKGRRAFSMHTLLA